MPTAIAGAVRRVVDGFAVGIDAVEVERASRSRHLVVPLLSFPVAYHQFPALEDDMGRMCENIEKVVMKTCKNIVKVVAKTC